MNLDTAGLGILLPAFVAGLLVSATHVPLGMQVLARGIVFIDLAVAQCAGLGVIVADSIGLEPRGAEVQLAALMAAIIAALAMTWTERRWPDLQEAIIGMVFVLAASGSVLLLAGNPRGGEHLRDLLVGQILWASAAWLPWVAVIYGVVLALWFGAGERGERLGRTGFYALFALTVTISVQLVGLYLVFATLIIPALATRALPRLRLTAAYAIAGLGYASGLLISGWSDLPPGALIPWTMAAIGVGAAACAFTGTNRLRSTRPDRLRGD